MTTPTKSQGVSTPKNAFSVTPNRPTASPRPTSAAFHHRPLAGKSPAVKTPASLHGHAHRLSMSSQPSLTPAAPAVHDELLNLNSPAAALIASIGNAGIDPLLSGQHDLGIAAGIDPAAIRGATLPKNTDAEREQRVREVESTLRAKVAGRGVTRKGVERLAKLEGFQTFWDDENLSIAGNSVDLEIVFDRIDQNTVRDAALRLVTLGSDEPRLQQDASRVLKEHLSPHDAAKQLGPWPSLDDFSTDLRYLGKHDGAECPENCFKVTGNLYETFRKIWNEERKRLRDRNVYIRTCQSNVGCPSMDKHHLGPALQYWTSQADFWSSQGVEKECEELAHGDQWNARFNCEKGVPFIDAKRDWLGEDILSSTVTTENVFQERAVDKPAWRDPFDPASKQKAPGEHDAEAADSNKAIEEVPKLLNVRFACLLQPTIWLPVNIAAGLNTKFPMLDVDQTLATTYQQRLYRQRTGKELAAGHSSLDHRWTKCQNVVNLQGQQTTRSHSYAFYTSSGGMWCYPVTTLYMSHPKHWADVVPTLRQHALLWSLLQGTNKGSGLRSEVQQTERTLPQFDAGLAKVLRRSNKNKTQMDLDLLMTGKEDASADVRIDLSLDLLTDATKVRLAVLIAARGKKFIRVVIIIKENAVIEVESIAGTPVLSGEKVIRKAAKVLAVSEDLGILAEWILQTEASGN